MHIPRVVKILVLVIVLYIVWNLGPSFDILGFSVLSASRPHGVTGSVGVYERTAATDILSCFGNYLELRHRIVRVENNRAIHWLYYPFMEFDPSILSTRLKARGYTILSVIGRKNGMVRAEKNVNGVSMVVSVFPDPEENALVVTVAVPTGSEKDGTTEKR